MGTGDLETCKTREQSFLSYPGNAILTPSVKENQDWLLCLGIARVLGPDIKLQAVFRRRVAVLSREVLPYTQPRRLGEVRERADWWLI